MTCLTGQDNKMAKRPWGEMSSGENSVGWIVMERVVQGGESSKGAIWLWGEIFVVRCPRGDMSLGLNVLGAHCPWGQNVHGAKCHGASCHGGSVGVPFNLQSITCIGSQPTTVLRFSIAKSLAMPRLVFKIARDYPSAMLSAKTVLLYGWYVITVMSHHPLYPKYGTMALTRQPLSTKLKLGSRLELCFFYNNKYSMSASLVAPFVPCPLKLSGIL